MILDWPSQSSDLSATGHVFHCLKDRLTAKKASKQARCEDGCSIGLAEHHPGKTRSVCML